MARISRLSWADLNNLAVEADDTPMHQIVLATLERAPLIDSDGGLRIADIRAHVAARLDRVPELRRILYRPGLLQGRPIWVDDPAFRIANHVLQATSEEGFAGLIAFAEHEMTVLMDRSRPLWQMCLIDDCEGGRLGLLIKVHHALADGPAMVNFLAEMFDADSVVWGRPVVDFVPAAPPSAFDLYRDNLSLKTASLGNLLGRIGHPVKAIRRAAETVSALAEEVRSGRGAPRTSLNRPIGLTRRIVSQQISLAEAKTIANRQGVTLNDVFLSLVAAGLHRVLAARGELVPGMTIRSSVAVSLPEARTSTSGNHVGAMIVALPADFESPTERLAAVAAATARAKTRQLPVVSTGLMVLLARAGITRAYIRRQHMLNVLSTNVSGPPFPVFFSGARVWDAIALPPLAGNVTVSFAALSYAGNLVLSVVADAGSWPDLQILDDGIRAGWTELVAATTAVQLPA